MGGRKLEDVSLGENRDSGCHKYTPPNAKPRVNAAITFCRLSVTSSKTKFVDRALLLDSAGEGTGFGMKDRVLDSFDTTSRRAGFEYQT